MTELLADEIPYLAGLAAQHLGWAPPAFWSATPPELILSLTDLSATPLRGMDRADLTRLMEHENNG